MKIKILYYNIMNKFNPINSAFTGSFQSGCGQCRQSTDYSRVAKGGQRRKRGGNPRRFY